MANRKTEHIAIDREVKEDIEEIRARFIDEKGIDVGIRGASIIQSEKAKRSPRIPFDDIFNTLIQREVRFRNVKKRR